MRGGFEERRGGGGTRRRNTGAICEQDGKWRRCGHHCRRLGTLPGPTLCEDVDRGARRSANADLQRWRSGLRFGARLCENVHAGGGIGYRGGRRCGVGFACRLCGNVDPPGTRGPVGVPLNFDDLANVHGLGDEEDGRRGADGAGRKGEMDMDERGKVAAGWGMQARESSGCTSGFRARCHVARRHDASTFHVCRTKVSTSEADGRAQHMHIRPRVVRVTRCLGPSAWSTDGQAGPGLGGRSYDVVKHGAACNNGNCISTARRCRAPIACCQERAQAPQPCRRCARTIGTDGGGTEDAGSDREGRRDGGDGGMDGSRVDGADGQGVTRGRSSGGRSVEATQSDQCRGDGELSVAVKGSGSDDSCGAAEGRGRSPPRGKDDRGRARARGRRERCRRDRRRRRAVRGPRRPPRERGQLCRRIARGAKVVGGVRHRWRRRRAWRATQVLVTFATASGPTVDRSDASRGGDQAADHRRTHGKAYRRIGEAKNPGPSGAVRRCWGAVGAQIPTEGGFQDVIAPGFSLASTEEARDGQGKELYALKVATANVTSWRSLTRLIRGVSADVVLVQEHKVTKGRLAERVAWLRRRGWNALMAAAEPGPNGGPSAGTAVIARSHVGMSMPLVGGETIVGARAVAARLEPPGCRPFTAIAAYLHDGEGLGRANLELLRDVGAFITAQGKEEQFILGADFQVTPEELSATAFAQEVSGVIMASGSPGGTCRTPTSAREIDYFVVSPGLASGVEAIELIRRSGIKTHVPVQLRFRARLTSLRALVLRRPPPLSVDRIIGPLRKLVQWEPMAEEARKLAADAANEEIDVELLHARLGATYKRWVDAAEEELVEAVEEGPLMPKKGLRGNAPVMVWRSILPERPRNNPQGEAVNLWRNVANAAMALQRLAMDAEPTDGDSGGNQAEAADGDGDDFDMADGDDEGPNVDAGHDGGMFDHEGGGELYDGMLRELAEDIAILWGEVRERDDGGANDDELARAAADAVANLSNMVGRMQRGGGQRPPTPEEVHTCRERITAYLDQLTKETRARDIAAWTSWLRDGIDSGARNAHRYLKVPQEWRPQAVRNPDGVVTASPAAIVDAYRTKYVTRWNGSADAAEQHAPRAKPPWAEAKRCAMPRTNAEELRAASKAFSRDSAVAFDGLAMRHYSLISDEGLEVLADIVLTMELIGRLPPQLDALVMPLIGKDRGGHRAITMATSLYRLWGRLRRGATQAWEASHDRPYFAAGKGRRVHDVVWRQLLTAEAGEGEGLASGGVLWDMATFFESINRSRLWALVRRHGFPMEIARLAFHTYDAPRVLTLDGRVACPAYARNGVPAGCPFAMALTRLFCLEPFDSLAEEIARKHPEVAVFDAFVDDLALTVTAPAGEIVDVAVEVAGWIRDKVEHVMGCEIELSKAAVVASDQRTANGIAQRLGAYAGPARQRVAAVNLGCDYAPGRRRTAHRMSGRRSRRYAALAKRARKLSGVRKALGSARRARRLFTTGLLPAAVPDAAVHGVSDREVLVLRRTAALACSPRARGRSLAMVTLLHDVPTWRAETEIVLQYSRQIWEAASRGHREAANGGFSLTKIARLWRAVDKDSIFIGAANGGQEVHDGAGDARRRRGGAAQRHSRLRNGRDGDGAGGARAVSAFQKRAEAPWRTDGRRRDWTAVRGPVGAMLLTLHRLGWQMPTPFVLVDDRGEELPLTKVTPTMLADLLREATRRALEHYIGGKLASEDEEFRGRRACVDHLARQLATDKRITREGKAAVMSVACNAVMTFSRAVAQGYMVHDICPMCGCAGDTIRHRVWECQHADVVEARRRAAPAWLIDEVRRRPRTQARWTTGVIPHPGDIWPRPSADAIPTAEFDGDGERPLSADCIPRLHGQVYVDGSCTNHVIHDLRRAGTSIVTMGHDDAPLWRIRMPLPSPMPQTSQAAEFAAMPMLLAYLGAAEGKWDVASDCLNVVHACSGPPARALSGQRRYGGVLKPVLADTRWGKQVTVRKVPAHVEYSALPMGPQRSDAVGNHWADKEAKAAVEDHPRPTPTMVQELEAELKRSRYVIRTIAAVMPLFPPMPAERMQRRPLAREGATLQGAGGHQWVYAAGCWRCKVCWTLTVKKDIDTALAHRRCDGPKQSIAAENIVKRGHVLGHAVGQVPIMFCTLCGAFSSRRAYGLGTACRGRPSPAGAQALARIRRGEQPWRTRHDKDGRRPRIEGHMAWSNSRAAFVGAGPSTRCTLRRRGDGDADGRGDELDGARRVLGDDGDRDQHGARAETWHEGKNAAVEVPTAQGTDGPQPMDYTHDLHSQCGIEESLAEEFDIFGHGGSFDQDDSQEQRCDRAKRRRVGEAGDDGAPAFRGCLMSAEAMSTDYSAVSARVGPGGPRVAQVTVAELPPETGDAVAAVWATSGGTATLTAEVQAREAQAERGEAVPRPPIGFAAPMDGADRDTVSFHRQVLSSPLAMPHRRGVGPRIEGLERSEGEGEGPAEAIARRRDGADAPAGASAAAWSGATAAVRARREKPEGKTGLPHRDPSARQSECTSARGNECSSNPEDASSGEASVTERASISPAAGGNGGGRGHKGEDDRERSQRSQMEEAGGRVREARERHGHRGPREHDGGGERERGGAADDRGCHVADLHDHPWPANRASDQAPTDGARQQCGMSGGRYEVGNASSSTDVWVGASASSDSCVLQSSSGSGVDGAGGGGGSTTADAFALHLREMSAAATAAASHRRANGDAASFHLSLRVRLQMDNYEAHTARRELAPALGTYSHGHARRHGFTCPAWASWATGSSRPVVMTVAVNWVARKVHAQPRWSFATLMMSAKPLGTAIRLGTGAPRLLTPIVRTPSALAAVGPQFEGRSTCLGRRAGMLLAVASPRRRCPGEVELPLPTALETRGHGRRGGSKRAMRTCLPRSVNTLRGWQKGTPLATVLRKVPLGNVLRPSGGGLVRRRGRRARCQAVEARLP